MQGYFNDRRVDMVEWREQASHRWLSTSQARDTAPIFTVVPLEGALICRAIFDRLTQSGVPGAWQMDSVRRSLTLLIDAGEVECGRQRGRTAIYYRRRKPKE
jgi:hypothetical protein